MTWAQHKAYRAGRFTPQYAPGSSDDVALDGEGEVFETFDVTDQGC